VAGGRPEEYDWIDLRTKYVRFEGSLREFAEIHGVDYDSLRHKASNEKWNQMRNMERAKGQASALAELDKIKAGKIGLRDLQKEQALTSYVALKELSMNPTVGAETRAKIHMRLMELSGVRSLNEDPNEDPKRPLTEDEVKALIIICKRALEVGGDS